jgi:NAD(P)-dependent dehydrogenase (short-subunit alcohol dehydrogenase family)
MKGLQLAHFFNHMRQSSVSMQKGGKEKAIRKKQRQQRPGFEFKMKPQPLAKRETPINGKLAGKVALVTGGDSGIGRAVAILFAQHGARIAISYLSENKDAADTRNEVEKFSDCLLLRGDLGKEKTCATVIRKVVERFGRIDILVNNAAQHYEQKSLEDISTQQLIKTFTTNVFPYFWITREALPYMKKGSCIVNTASVTAYRGSGRLIDYAATKGAIVSFTRSLSSNLVKKGIRVNGVAPGPIWTPLIPSTFAPKEVANFGSDVPMERAGEPAEVAPCYLFLASEDSSYMTGQFLHPNGGEIVNG